MCKTNKTSLAARLPRDSYRWAKTHIYKAQHKSNSNLSRTAYAYIPQHNLPNLALLVRYTSRFWAVTTLLGDMQKRSPGICTCSVRYRDTQHTCLFLIRNTTRGYVSQCRRLGFTALSIIVVQRHCHSEDWVVALLDSQICCSFSNLCQKSWQHRFVGKGRVDHATLYTRLPTHQ